MKSSRQLLEFLVSASFSLQSVAPSTRARALDKPGAAVEVLGIWTSFSVLLDTDAARLLCTCAKKPNKSKKAVRGGIKWMDGDQGNVWNPTGWTHPRIMYLFQCIAQAHFRSEGSGLSHGTCAVCSRWHKPRFFNCIPRELAWSSRAAHFNYCGDRKHWISAHLTIIIDSKWKKNTDRAISMLSTNSEEMNLTIKAKEWRHVSVSSFHLELYRVFCAFILQLSMVGETFIFLFFCLIHNLITEDTVTGINNNKQ